MMIAMMMMVLMTTNAAFHELGYAQKVVSPGISRKLMLKKMGEEYPDQDLVFYTDQKKDLFADELQKRGEEEVMVIGIGKEGSDPNYKLDTMDYSRVRRRRPIHNNSSSKSNNNSP